MFTLRVERDPSCFSKLRFCSWHFDAWFKISHRTCSIHPVPLVTRRTNLLSIWIRPSALVSVRLSTALPRNRTLQSTAFCSACSSGSNFFSPRTISIFGARDFCRLLNGLFFLTTSVQSCACPRRERVRPPFADVTCGGSVCRPLCKLFMLNSVVSVEQFALWAVLYAILAGSSLERKILGTHH